VSVAGAAVVAGDVREGGESSATVSSSSPLLPVSGAASLPSERTLANRRKRGLKKLRKQRKQGFLKVPAVGGDVVGESGVGNGGGSSAVGGGAVEVPEWRRGGGSAVRRGFLLVLLRRLFEGCGGRVLLG